MELTLNDELKRFINANRRNKLFKNYDKDSDSLIIFFETYFGGRTLDKENNGIVDDNMKEILKDGDFLYNIVQGVKSYQNDKAKLTERLDLFLQHLKKHYKFNYDENIFCNYKVKDKKEKLLMMLKYLHSGEKSRAEIADDFGISERALSDYLAELQNGITFLGTKMNINSLERGENKYRSLIHPVFLALNSAEIYSLTAGLKLISKDTVYEESLGRIADAVYEQLSQDSKNMIDKHKDGIVQFGNDKMEFINSWKIAQNSEKPFTYFLKEPLECIVAYNKDGNKVEYCGKLKLVEPYQGNLYNRVKIEMDEQSIILDMDNIISIKRADKDEYFKDW